ncbi:MAG: helix-turn-helix transcriptional regulator [Planctomycetes bacterium]|nr:helix-turn-helix transcriptional regulator [Planctomycetota bacterium]
MDTIDRNLLDAWRRIGDEVRRDRVEVLRRSYRRLTPTLTRPPRAWCLCLRACDTRISPVTCAIELDPNVELPINDSLESALAHGAPHTVTLTGAVIHRLCIPVSLPWPGMDWTIAAQRLGRHEETLRRWIKLGILRARYDNAVSHGKRGKPVPIVWSPSPLDPNTNHGQPPDPVWGTLWQTLWKRLPEDYQLIVRREARFVHYRGEPRQRGWQFVCPGRLRSPPISASMPRASRELPDAALERIACNRRVKRLYAPQSTWTIAQQLGDDRGFAISPLPPGDGAEGSEADDGGLCLAGAWHPRQIDPIKAMGPRSFACHHCWRVQFTSLLNHVGWNTFVTHVSGGLLYGHEVERPLDEAPKRRKKRFVPHPRPAPRRREVSLGLLQGLTYQQIADRMGITYSTVHAHVKKIYKQHAVHSREELITCLGKQRTSPSMAPTAAGAGHLAADRPPRAVLLKV